MIKHYDQRNLGGKSLFHFTALELQSLQEVGARMWKQEISRGYGEILFIDLLNYGLFSLLSYAFKDHPGVIQSSVGCAHPEQIGGNNFLS